eukprot:3934814-Rhodomonas_salina.2
MRLKSTPRPAAKTAIRAVLGNTGKEGRAAGCGTLVIPVEERPVPASSPAPRQRRAARWRAGTGEGRAPVDEAGVHDVLALGVVFTLPLAPEHQHIQGLPHLDRPRVKALALALLQHVLHVLHCFLDGDVLPDRVLLPDAVVAQKREVCQAQQQADQHHRSPKLVREAPARDGCHHRTACQCCHNSRKGGRKKDARSHRTQGGCKDMPSPADSPAHTARPQVSMHTASQARTRWSTYRGLGTVSETPAPRETAPQISALSQSVTDRVENQPSPGPPSSGRGGRGRRDRGPCWRGSA